MTYERSKATVNLLEIENNYDVIFQPKRIENPEDASLRRFKDKYLFITALMTISITYAVCIGILFLKPDSWGTIALNCIYGLTTTLIGYYAGGRSR